MPDSRTEWQKISDALKASADMGFRRLEGMPKWADEKCRWCKKDIRKWEDGNWRHWDGYIDCDGTTHEAEPKEKK